MTPTLEICVDDLAGMNAAIAGGADRLELCSALACGGLTPSLGLMELAAEAPVAVHAMIRPRSGNFVFSRDDVRLMIRDIVAARQIGLSGVVLGASLPDGRLDCEALQHLLAAADGMDVTLHRAFDLVPDQMQALAEAQALGFRRILTSGGKKSAPEGLDALKKLVSASQGRVSIMPGGGLTIDNLEQFADLGISEFHASCSRSSEVAPTLVNFGFELEQRRQTDEDSVRQMKQGISSIASKRLENGGV
ncbi:copper homeostasis protein [Agrobacterium vitis]|nr:copper homeostasis protein [Agrobacterium vitis]MBE1436659.1 copper homeostasis protein [Agrobacterium vitis]